MVSPDCEIFINSKVKVLLLSIDLLSHFLQTIEHQVYTLY